MASGLRRIWPVPRHLSRHRWNRPAKVKERATVVVVSIARVAVQPASEQMSVYAPTVTIVECKSACPELASFRATHGVTSSSKHQGATTVPAASSEAAVQPHPGPPIPAACSHCAKLSPHGFSGTDPFKAQTCSVCDDRSELWVCLHCEKVFCGRFANRHGVIHWLNTKCEHSVLMSLSDGTIWCYLCREYQHHDASSVLSSFYAAFHMAQHGEAPPVASLMRQNSLLSPDTLSGDELAMLSAFDAKQFRWNKWNSQSSSQSSENGGS